MDSQDMDKLLEQSLRGESPGPMFHARVLRASTAAFIHARGSRARWRLAALSTAAVFLAAVSFLLGRCSAPPGAPRPTAGPALASTAETVAVPSELVVWLDAARLFRQLGMADRMGRALDHASKLLPHGAVTARGAGGPVFAVGGEGSDSQSGHAGPSRMPDPRQPAESVNLIMAQCLGDYGHANGTD